VNALKSLIIGGEEVDTGEYSSIVNPANGEPFEKVSVIKDKDLIKRSIDLAEDSFREFSKLPLKDRSKILMKASEIMEMRKEDLAKTLSLESGKPIKDSRVEILRAISVFKIAAEEARFVLEGKVHRVDAYEYPPGNQNRIVMEVREPLGIVAAILPFNFPANSFAHKVAPNIVAGNTVIVKPSVSTPLSALELGKIMYEAGLPRGVLSVLIGDSAVIGDELITSKKIQGITFTGSTKVGLSIASKAVLTSKRLMMEMGGSDPIIVLNDADIEKAVNVSVKARFEYAGQNCNAGKRIIVHEDVYDKFSKMYIDAVNKLKVGDPLDENTDVGPIISNTAVNTMNDFIEDAKNKGAKIYSGLRIQKGYYYPLTVLINASPDMKVMKEEVFGPLAPIVKFSSIDEAIDIANSTDYGLQSAIFTKDLNKALRISKELKFGAVIINNSTRLRWDALPFGGVRMSGLGNREGVRNTIMTMTEPKILSIELE